MKNFKGRNGLWLKRILLAVKTLGLQIIPMHHLVPEVLGTKKINLTGRVECEQLHQIWGTQKKKEITEVPGAFQSPVTSSKG